MSPEAPISASAHRAYVLDDDAGFRQSMVMLLESAGWEVEAFASADEFTDRSDALESGILLLDLNLDGTSGLDLIEHNIEHIERFAVVMITGAGKIQTAVRSIKAGAIDFIEKPFAPDELLDRLNTIETEFTASLQAKAAQWNARRRVASLSARERHVLERLLSGASNKLIARDLGLSPRTVEMHRARMLQKLGAATTAEALEIGRVAGTKAVIPTES
jgi:two-component system response regulator FixJ